MGNPYRYRESDVSLHDAQIREAHNHRHFAWAEGDATGYARAKAEQAKTKDDLIQALDENVDEAHRLLAEQAEIVSDLKATIVAYEIAISKEEKLVSELVEAFKYYIAYGARTTTTSGRIAWKKARTVIAKATGI